MGVLADAAEWIEELYGLTRDDDVDADVVEGDMAGKANRQALELGKRTRYLRGLIKPLSDRISVLSPSGVLQVLNLAGIDLKSAAPRFVSKNDREYLFAAVDDDGVGTLATTNPIIGGTTAGGTNSPYGLHGAADYEVINASGVQTLPLGISGSKNALGGVRLYQSSALGSDQSVTIPPAPATWARAYTKWVVNQLTVSVLWKSGATTLDVQLPGETVLYVRGPGSSDWLPLRRQGRARLDGGTANQSGTLALSSASYTTAVTTNITNVAVGDVLEATFSCELDGTGTGTAWDVLCSIKNPGGGSTVDSQIATITNTGRQLGGITVKTVPVTLAGTFIADIAIKNAASGTAVAQRGRISWSRFR